MAVVDFLNQRFGADAPIEEVGIGGFRLLARTRQTFTYTSQVPTAYLEDGSSASDHIVLEPLTLQIDGSVSDVYVEPSAAVAALRGVQGAVGNFAGYLPGQTQAQLQKLNGLAAQVLDRARQIDRVIEDGKQALSFLGDQRPEEAVGLRERFIDSMEQLHYGKQLIGISMPFRRFDSMRITSIAFTQDNQTEAISFSISAQKVRMTSTEFVELEEVEAGTRGAASEGLGKQTEAEADKGAQEGEPAARSLLGSISGIFGGGE